MMTRELPSISQLFATLDASLAIDVVKTRIQIDPELARHSLLSGGRKIVASEGPTVRVILILTKPRLSD
jgi:hypothetical protein